MLKRNRLDLLLIIGLLLSGCASHQLREDPMMPALQAEYPTAEFYACGERWHGLGVCALKPGQLYDQVELAVQGYYNGSVKVDSANCDLAFSTRYQNHAQVSVELKGKAEKSCLVSFVVQPEYPEQDKSTFPVYGFKGHLAIRVLAEDTKLWVPDTRKLTGIISGKVTLPVLGEAAKVAFGGCGEDFVDKKMAVVNDQVEVPLEKLVQAKPGLCVLEGAAVTKLDMTETNVLVAQYNPKFTALEIPAVTIDGDEITIDGSDAVSVIAVNDDFRFGRKNSFKLNKGAVNTIRLLTAGGRSVLGTVKKDGGVEWKQ